MSDEPVGQVACRKCAAEMAADAKFCPACGATQKVDQAPIFLVILLLSSSFLLLSSSLVTVKQTWGESSNSSVAVAKDEPVADAPKDISASAYYAAKKVLYDRYPKAKYISEMKESSLEQQGKTFKVTLYVDGLDGQAAGRNMFVITVSLENGKWKLDGVEE